MHIICHICIRSEWFQGVHVPVTYQSQSLGTGSGVGQVPGQPLDAGGDGETFEIRSLVNRKLLKPICFGGVTCMQQCIYHCGTQMDAKY